MHLCSSSIIHNSQNVEATQVAIHGWISKMYYTHTMEYYSAFKRKEVLRHATTWMNFDNIMLSQSQKDFTCMRYIEHSNSETEIRRATAKGWGEKRMNYCLTDIVCILQHKRVLQIGCTIWMYLLTLLNCTPKNG